MAKSRAALCRFGLRLGVFLAGEALLPSTWWAAVLTAFTCLLVFVGVLWHIGLASDDAAMIRTWFSRRKEVQE